ncbi:MAG: CPXCG motif-containing cysteine-rich protein [Bacteroidetes bacterium]|nr:MAG: CPXCG motif-containing cysteine-rich protein [Bacteroidota bacterium]
MNALECIHTQCPYCGEGIDLLADASAGSQSYSEDCPVCCRPMVVQLSIDESGIQVIVGSEND